MNYEQLALFDLTEAICATAKRIADGEIVNAEDKLDLAEQLYEARRRMPADQEFGNWWRTTGIKFKKSWRAVMIKAGGRVASAGRPGIHLVDTGAEFSIRRFAETGDGWITGDDDPAAPSAGDPETDEWYTPAWLFDALGLTFDVDVCAPVDRTHVATPAERFYTEADDGLAQPWDGLVWCNPPYSTPEPWMTRMLDHGDGVWLSHVPINGLWCLRAWHECSAVRLLQGMEFVRPSGDLQRPAWWLQLVAFGGVAAKALQAMTVDDQHHWAYVAEECPDERLAESKLEPVEGLQGRRSLDLDRKSHIDHFAHKRGRGFTLLSTRFQDESFAKHRTITLRRTEVLHLRRMHVDRVMLGADLHVQMYGTAEVLAYVIVAETAPIARYLAETPVEAHYWLEAPDKTPFIAMGRGVRNGRGTLGALGALVWADDPARPQPRGLW